MFLFKQSQKKCKDILETRVVILIYLLELEISVMILWGIYQDSEKWLLSVRVFLVEVTLRIFSSFFVVMTLVMTMRYFLLL